MGKTAARAHGRPAELLSEVRRAVESKDIDAYASLFAEEATLQETSSISPPAHPAVVHGREAIRERLHDDAFRDPVGGWARSVIDAQVVDGVETDDKLAFLEIRTYAGGEKIVAQHLATKRDGRIEMDRVVVAYDPGL